MYNDQSLDLYVNDLFSREENAQKKLIVHINAYFMDNGI